MMDEHPPCTGCNTAPPGLPGSIGRIHLNIDDIIDTTYINTRSATSTISGSLSNPT